ncbi:zinc finger and BTB domain-containing protein 24-like isoform X2 [Hetaerina americana]|uniref:zinc finger and BTB domain-containing protein 24-like isoform X2 n=1 Tax=Hetaerina americana TaxID=62018 RepID=UPI003A7F3736
METKAFDVSSFAELTYKHVQVTRLLPQALKNEPTENEVSCAKGVEIVELDESSDDENSGAETVCAPSPPAISISSDDDSSVCSLRDVVEDNDDVEIFCQPSTSAAADPNFFPEQDDLKFPNVPTSNAVYIPIDKHLEESLLHDEQSMLVSEDPLFNEKEEVGGDYYQSGDDSSGSDVDVEEIDETFDIRLIEHCSRTLGRTTKGKTKMFDPFSIIKVADVVQAGMNDSSRKIPAITLDQNETSNSNKSSKDKIKKCLQCSVKFKTKQELKDHMNKKECFIVRCSFCQTLLLRPQLEEHLKNCTKKPLPYICIICKKSFALMQSLIGHQASHANDNINLCFVCGEAFDRKKMLKAHRKKCVMTNASKHVPLFPILRCGKCSSAYYKISSLRWHMRHTKHQSCLCGVCGISCASVPCLSSHIRTNHKNWCYQCDKCTKYFVDMSQMKCHSAKCH